MLTCQLLPCLLMDHGSASPFPSWTRGPTASFMPTAWLRMGSSPMSMGPFDGELLGTRADWMLIIAVRRKSFGVGDAIAEIVFFTWRLDMLPLSQPRIILARTSTWTASPSTGAGSNYQDQQLGWSGHGCPKWHTP